MVHARNRCVIMISGALVCINLSTFYTKFRISAVVVGRFGGVQDAGFRVQILFIGISTEACRATGDVVLGSS